MRPTKISDIQQEIKKGIPLPIYDNETLRYVQKPIGQELYKYAVDENVHRETIHRETDYVRYKTHSNPKGAGRYPVELLAKPTDKINCKLCGQLITRSNQTHHRRTKNCQIYARMNEKLKDLLLD